MPSYKQEMRPPLPTEHPDPRMHLRLDDLKPLFQAPGEPKVTYPMGGPGIAPSATAHVQGAPDP